MAKAAKNTAPVIEEAVVISETVSTPVPVQRTFENVVVNDPQKVFESKRFVKGGLQFLSPTELFKEQIKLFSGINCTLHIKANGAVENAEEGGQVNTSYSRIALTAVYEIDADMKYEVGMLAAFDLGAPKLKIYRGAITSVCLNLNVWGSDDVVKFEIGNGINNDMLKAYLDGVNEQIQKTAETVARLKARVILPEEMYKIIGRMIFETKKNRAAVGTTLLIAAIDLLTEPTSKYNMMQENFNAWLLYNAITESFNEKVSFFDVPDKSASTFKLLTEAI